MLLNYLMSAILGFIVAMPAVVMAEELGAPGDLVIASGVIASTLWGLFIFAKLTKGRN